MNEKNRMETEMLDAMMSAVMPFLQAADAAAPGQETPAVLTVTYYPVSQAVCVTCRDADGRAVRVFKAQGDSGIAAAVGAFLQAGMANLPSARRQQALDAINAEQAVLAVLLTRDPDTAAAKLLEPIADELGNVEDVRAGALFQLTTPETRH